MKKIILIILLVFAFNNINAQNGLIRTVKLETMDNCPELNAMIIGTIYYLETRWHYKIVEEENADYIISLENYRRKNDYTASIIIKLVGTKRGKQVEYKLSNFPNRECPDSGLLEFIAKNSIEQKNREECFVGGKAVALKITEIIFSEINNYI